MGYMDEGGTSNIQHRTTNVQWLERARGLGGPRSYEAVCVLKVCTIQMQPTNTAALLQKIIRPR